VFYAVAHYFIDGNWTLMEPGGYMMFTLEGGSVDPSEQGCIRIPGGSDIDMDKISRALNETITIGLDYIGDIETPEEFSDIEETIKEKTCIPGFPVEALNTGATLLGLALRKRV
jgi:hypothetical protein